MLSEFKINCTSEWNKTFTLVFSASWNKISIHKEIHKLKRDSYLLEEITTTEDIWEVESDELIKALKCFSILSSKL